MGPLSSCAKNGGALHNYSEKKLARCTTTLKKNGENGGTAKTQSTAKMLENSWHRENPGYRRRYREKQTESEKRVETPGWLAG